MMRGFRMGRRGPYPASGKIYDITHADTDEHSVSLPAGYPENIKALFVNAQRIAGSGTIFLRSGAGYNITQGISHSTNGWWIRALDGLFYYRMSIANDDWDIHAVGHIAA